MSRRQRSPAAVSHVNRDGRKQLHVQYTGCVKVICRYTYWMIPCYTSMTASATDGLSHAWMERRRIPHWGTAIRVAWLPRAPSIMLRLRPLQDPLRNAPSSFISQTMYGYACSERLEAKKSTWRIPLCRPVARRLGQIDVFRRLNGYLTRTCAIQVSTYSVIHKPHIHAYLTQCVPPPPAPISLPHSPSSYPPGGE